MEDVFRKLHFYTQSSYSKYLPRPIIPFSASAIGPQSGSLLNYFNTHLHSASDIDKVSLCAWET